MVLFTGETVEEAIEKGLSTLGVSRIKAHITVVSREKKGFLGFGKKPAQVEIRPIIQQEEEDSVQAVNGERKEVNPVETPIAIESNKVIPAVEESAHQKPEVTSDDKSLSEETAPEPSNVISLSDRREQQKASVSSAQMSVDESAKNDSETSKKGASVVSRAPLSKDMEKASQEVSAYVEKIIYEMDVEATIETSHNRRNIFLQIETPEAGRVIGYHGKVLKSLQLLAQNYLHDYYSKNFTVTLNVHDYMEHRIETLIEFANKMSERVLETGRDVSMDPMSNQERKTIHKAVSRIKGVTSYSEGSDPERYVVITLSE